MGRIFSIGLLIVLPATVGADDGPKPAMSPKERLEAIQSEYKAVEAAFSKAAQALPDTSEGEKKGEELFETYNKGRADRIMAAVELAKADPTSDVGFAALEWVLTNPLSYHLPAGKPAMELATANHAANPKIGKIIAWVGYYMPHEGTDSLQAAKALIRTVAEKNPDRTARGQAVMALAWQARRRFVVAGEKAANVDELAVAAEKAFEAVVKDYADCPRLMREGQRSLGEEAKQELVELRHLRVGMVAPNLEGEDLEGAKFSLNDYRGKVRLIVFWASWCGPCMEMVPRERKLAARFKDRAFVLIGVNGDDDRDKAKQVTAKEEMTWRSFWNGPKGPDGSLTRAWNVRGWPTIYVLDDRGVIRYKGIRSEELLNKAVDELLVELENNGTGQK